MRRCHVTERGRRRMSCTPALARDISLLRRSACARRRLAKLSIRFRGGGWGPKIAPMDSAGVGWPPAVGCMAMRSQRQRTSQECQSHNSPSGIRSPIRASSDHVFSPKLRERTRWLLAEVWPGWGYSPTLTSILLTRTPESCGISTDCGQSSERPTHARTDMTHGHA